METTAGMASSGAVYPPPTGEDRNTQINKQKKEGGGSITNCFQSINIHFPL